MCPDYVSRRTEAEERKDASLKIIRNKTTTGVGATPLTPLKPLEIVGSVHDPSMSLYRKEYLGTHLFSSEFSANNC